jgi:hypothetical protein
MYDAKQAILKLLKLTIEKDNIVDELKLKRNQSFSQKKL